MAGYKNGRITSDIHRELAAIIRTVKDPRVSSLTNIVKVDVSSDLSYAKVYISTIEGEEKLKETVKGLKSACGYIKKQLSNGLKLRKVPELKFIADDSIVKSADIASIIESFSKNKSEEDAIG